MMMGNDDNLVRLYMEHQIRSPVKKAGNIIEQPPTKYQYTQKPRQPLINTPKNSLTQTFIKFTMDLVP